MTCKRNQVNDNDIVTHSASTTHMIINYPRRRPSKRLSSLEDTRNIEIDDNPTGGQMPSKQNYS